MNMQTRIERLEQRAEDAAVKRMSEECDLTLLADDELISLEACMSQAQARGVPVGQLITPELEAIIDKCFSGKGAAHDLTN
jgi:hypothetical protein